MSSKVSKETLSKNSTYVVFTSYYKHGEVGMEQYSGDKELRDGAYKFYKYWHKEDSDECESSLFTDECESSLFTDESIDNVLTIMLTIGKTQILTQGGWAWRYVVRITNGEVTTYPLVKSTRCSFSNVGYERPELFK